MKIMTFNARVWDRDKDKSSEYYWKTRMQAMRTMIVKEDPDIICFQEMFFPATLYIPNNYKRVGFSFHHHIFVKKGIKHRCWFFGIFFQFADIIYNDNKFRLFCIHGNWKLKIQDYLVKCLTNHYKNPSIMCGDFNMVYSDLLKYYDFNKKFGESARVSLNLPESDTFQHFKKDQHFEIDHFFLNGIQPKSYKVIYDNYGAKRISDHYPVIIEI